jgi:hypothetical protein
LKTLGEMTVPVKIHRDVTARVKVKVVAEYRVHDFLMIFGDFPT